MRTASVMSVSLQPGISAQVTRIAKEEKRTVSDVFREALREYTAARVLRDVRKQARKTAKKLKIKPEDIESLIDFGRH